MINNNRISSKRDKNKWMLTSERRASQRATHDELLKHFSNTEKPSVNVKPGPNKKEIFSSISHFFQQNELEVATS